MSFNEFTNRYLNFNSSQKAGIIALLAIIAVLYFLPDYIYKTQNEKIKLDTDNVAYDNINTDENIKTNAKSVNGSINKRFSPFYFDPNTVVSEELKKFGVSEYVIKNFTKYRNSGAVFKTKNDFKKIYGLKPELYSKIESFIRIEIYKPKINTEKKVKIEENPIVEINSADSATLIKIKGIGPYLASKIIKYRNALGGFVNLNQLYEIYSLKKEMVDVFASQIKFDLSFIKKINLNTAEYNDLKKHPYLNGREAWAIIKYRSQHGLFNQIEDLKQVAILKPETIEKIKPYIEF
ncbi:MAG: helix-hairpin-helix domain-containing protein [Bacteroidetes bacterium]|nr:helix-hairpin-helix domain-containing protein [Bacteroidota bacterium]